jgi:delta24(24(1))-sterol reductase
MREAHSKPHNPGFVETPGRKKYTRRSVAPSTDGDESTPEPDYFPKPAVTGAVSDNDSIANGNGKLNGKTNGYTNGHVNGHANGNANGHTNGVANGHARKESIGANDYENFGPYDTSGEREFGGSCGMLAMMICFPALMYYMWIGAYFYDGKFPKPTADQSYAQFFGHMWSLVKTEAYPNARAWKIYWVFGLVQMVFYMYMPGVWRKGKALPHLRGKQLDYYCSAMWSFYTSVVLALVLNFTGVFRLYTLLEEFGHIMSVAIISGFLCALIAYVSAIARGATIRMTGWPIYDYFLGAELNPRLFGIVDIKMFLEVRIPWFMMFFMTLGTCLRQYEQHGYVSAPACFMLFAHYLYTGSCAKGEHLIITTW